MPDPNNPGGHLVTWMGRPQLRYRMMTGTNLMNWTQQGAELIGQRNALSATVTIPEPENRIFHQLDYSLVPAQANELLYSSFFLEYADFSY